MRGKEIAEPGCVPPMSQAVDQSHRNGIADAEKHDGNGCCAEPGRDRSTRSHTESRGPPRVSETSLTVWSGLPVVQAMSSTMSQFSTKPTWRRNVS
jgi:hypothetical protein